MPAIGLVALDNILCKGKIRFAVDRNLNHFFNLKKRRHAYARVNSKYIKNADHLVVIVEDNQLAEAKVPG